jgi:hypothetical protein
VSALLTLENHMSAQPAEDLPTLREELDRKVFETLNWMITGHAKGILTADQFSMGMDTLFMAVNGLVDKDFVQIISTTQDMTRGNPAMPVRRVFRHKESDSTVIFTWKPGSFSFTLTRYTGHMLTDEQEKPFDEREHARDYVLAVHKVLEKKGYIEL